MALGGGPPMLSLLTGVARGVSAGEEAKRARMREAMLDRLRMEEAARAAEYLDIQKRHADRLEEQTVLENERRRVAAATQRAQARQEMERQGQSAEALAQQMVADNPGLPIERAMVRARGIIAGDLPEYEPPPSDLDRQEQEADIALTKARTASELRDPVSQGRSLSPKQVREDAFEAEVNEILDNTDIIIALQGAGSMMEAAAMARRNPYAAAKGYNAGAMAEAWKRMGGQEATHSQRQSELTNQARLQMEKILMETGNFDRARTEISRIIQATQNDPRMADFNAEIMRVLTEAQAEAARAADTERDEHPYARYLPGYESPSQPQP